MYEIFELLLASIYTYKDFINQYFIFPSLILGWVIVRKEYKGFLTFPIVFGIVCNMFPAYDKIKEITALDMYYKNEQEKVSRCEIKTPKTNKNKYVKKPQNDFLVSKV